jgi:hypothetical protein
MFCPCVCILECTITHALYSSEIDLCWLDTASFCPGFRDCYRCSVELLMVMLGINRNLERHHNIPKIDLEWLVALTGNHRSLVQPMMSRKPPL